jgi:hypothetical protein
MNRRTFFAAMLGVGGIGVGGSAATTLRTSAYSEDAFTIASGMITASDHELADGWFAIAQATAVHVKPDSAGWLRMRELRNLRIDLIARVLD